MRPIFFRGKPYSFSKTYFEGTHRSLSPEKTWEKIAPMGLKIGVTRIANITGLDRIGIPVASSIRPASPTLSISSGKGITLASAYVSALMESFEIFSAENGDRDVIRGTYEELSQKNRMVPVHLLSLRKNSLFRTDWPERWMAGWDLLSQQEVLAPLLSIILNFQIQRKDPQDLSSFQMTSNGLASGNDFLEALSSAIYEAIERDSASCHLHASADSSYYPPRVDLASIPYPAVHALLEKLKIAGVRPLLYDCQTDVGVPVFMATVYDEKERHAGISHGYGAHLDTEVAILRALTEAVQGRAIINAGSRDDNFSSFYQLYKKFDTFREVEEIESCPTSPLLCQCGASMTFEEDVASLLAKLKAVGIEQVIAYDLTPPGFPVSAARVVIPGLEDYYSHGFVPRQRAQKFALQVQASVQPKPSLRGLHFPAGAQI